ncbi:MAG: ATP-binding protein [Verrucomicrobia bacterium]|nr:MAG: ATP-binding protein [Verrucomicrobiota bacterium]
MSRVNPFRPNSPVGPGMFAGRLSQLRALEEALLQTRAGQPKSFMLTGERGIGKTSLLQYFKWIAQGHIDIARDRVNFLVVELDLDASSTDLGLIRRVNLALDRELTKTEPARSFLSTGWEFLQRIEAFGVGLRDGKQIADAETLHDEFAHSLAKTCNRISQADATSVFGAQYDGLILLIDEADNAPRALRIGSFLKLLTERVQRHGCEHLMVGLAGMPALREVLRESHPSSLRLFDELPLDTLSRDDVSWVIDRALRVANETNDEKTTIDDAGRAGLINLSEGYPHFIQQFGYSAFSTDTDLVIDIEDVRRGAFGPLGAMEKIGDRYYRDDFYNKIQKDSYRQVLRIMADDENRWVTKPAIRSKFRGTTTTLDNAIHALRERKIILAKEGERGTYRLQHRGFAFWIKLYTSDPKDLQSQIEATGKHEEPAT